MAATDVERRITRARTHLLLDHPWFGSLALNLRIEEDNTVPTIGTDGTYLLYNAEFVTSVSDKELIALMAHEVMHCALTHPYRGKGREQRSWNEACDIVINRRLREGGFELPFTELQAEEAQYGDMSAEQVYALRQSKQQKGQGQGQGHSGACDMKQAPSSGSNNQSGDQQGQSAGSQMTEADWQILTEQASAVARRAGQMPGDLDRALKAALENAQDWRTILRRFIENTVPSDYSWTQPNRRYISQGIYLPGVVRENMPKIGIAVDTSGSIDAQMLGQFASEITAIVHEARPESVEVIYVDTHVQNVETFYPDDGEITLKARGGGGTAFQPAIDHFAKDPPVCMIYLTDLEGSQPKEPEFPVLWVLPEWQKREAWFGETVRMAK